MFCYFFIHFELNCFGFFFFFSFILLLLQLGLVLYSDISEIQYLACGKFSWVYEGQLATRDDVANTRKIVWKMRTPEGRFLFVFFKSLKIFCVVTLYGIDAWA